MKELTIIELMKNNKTGGEIFLKTFRKMLNDFVRELSSI